MTKNIPSKPHHRGGNPKGSTEKKSQHQNSNATTNHSQNENPATQASAAVLIAVQKASIDLKMLTPEQRRLASLMNDKVDVSEIEKKINKIMELTGASKDKAIVALHDCANELDKAIDMILEGDSINESEWKSQARKKKPKQGTQPSGKDSVHLNGDAKKGTAGKGRQIRGKQQAPSDKAQSQQPYQSQNRSERRPRVGGDWKSSSRENNNNATNNLNDESATPNNKDLEMLDDKLDEWADETQGSAGGAAKETRDRSRVMSGHEFKPHSNRTYQNNNQDNRRINSGPRGSYNRNSSNSNQFGQGGDRSNQRDRTGGSGDRMMERRTYQNKGYGVKKPSYTNSIDTWSNLTAADNTTPSTDYAQVTVGNWSDVVSSSSNAASAVQQPSSQNNSTQKTDLNNDDEWTEPSESLQPIEQATNKVFTSSKDQNVSSTNKPDDHQLSKMPNLASIVSGVKPVQQQQQSNVHKSPQQQQATSKPPSQQQILSTSNNQSILNKSSPQQPQPQRQPQTNQQTQNKIDLAALLKSSSQQQQQTTNNLIRGNIQQQQQQQQQQRTNQPDSNAYGAALLQRLQQRIHTEQDPSIGKQASANLNDYVNHPYNQNKNLVHNIPPNSYSTQQNAPPNLFDNQSHHLHHQNVADQKSLIEKKRRQTKIPETAVEMPTSEHISSLNVQFGALDFSSSADSYGLNDDHQIASKAQGQFNMSRDNNSEKTNSASLLSTVRGGQQQSNDNKQQQAKDSLLQNIDHHHSSHHPQLQDNILHHQHADSRNKSQQQQQQQQSAGAYHLNTYNKNDNSNQHSSIYPPNLQNYPSSYGSVNSYGSQNHNSSHNNSASNANTAGNASQQQPQKINLKDLKELSENSSSNNNHNNSSTANNTNSSNAALSNLVNNSTVTTNVLKNSLTATGKTGGNNSMQQLNVAPNVAPPLLGTPQYIMNMSQPGLSTAFYPVYDMPMAADHSFRYNQNTQDVKYNRSVDAQDGQVGQSNHGNPVQSTQAPVTQTPNHQIFSQFPPYFFYTGVNMMTQGLYQTPFLPVQPNPQSGNVNQPHGAPNSNQPPHSGPTSFGRPKGAQNQGAYSAASYASSTGYDPITGHQLTQGQDFSKQNYSSGPPNSNQNQQQSGKQMSSGGSNDLVNSNMYTKSHAQLTKNFDKPAFQTGTPPPFGIATLGYNPNQFIPMMQPQSNPSMLHHSLQGDASQNVNSGVAGQRSQAQKNSASKNYYNWS